MSQPCHPAKQSILLRLCMFYRNSILQKGFAFFSRNCLLVQNLHISVADLAEIMLRSPRKLFIFIIKNIYICWIKVSKKKKNVLSERKRWCRWLIVPRGRPSRRSERPLDPTMRIAAVRNFLDGGQAVWHVQQHVWRRHSSSRSLLLKLFRILCSTLKVSRRTGTVRSMQHSGVPNEVFFSRKYR